MPYTERDLQLDLYTKVMLMAPPKAGKTYTILTTAPKPIYVANGDPGGLLSALRAGAKFTYDDCFRRSPLEKAVKHCEETNRPGAKNPYATIVVDTISLMSQSLEDEIKQRGVTGWDIYRELKEILVGTMRRLLNLPAHVILVAHATESGGEAGALGTVPLMSGQAKTILPALCSDWLWLEVTPAGKDGDTKREFLLGPQGNWKHGCRSLKSEGRMEADFTAFIKRIGAGAPVRNNNAPARR